VSNSPTIADLGCSICGAPVGYRELYPPGVPRAAGRGDEHPGRRLDRPWQYVSDGDGYGFGEPTPAEFVRAVEALAGEHPENFLKLYCHHYGPVYCFDPLEGRSPYCPKWARREGDGQTTAARAD
jgi:hypothetical protein